MKNTKIKTTKDTENITNISAAIKNAVDYLIANPKDFPGLAASGKLYDDALVANTTLQNLNGGASQTKRKTFHVLSALLEHCILS